MELVYYKNLKDEPYTTLNIIADSVDMNFEAVRNKFYRYRSELEKFGVVLHENGKTPITGRPEKVWKLNEQQATLLISLLGNAPKVVQFKVDLVHAFYTVKQELDKRKVERQVNRLLNIRLAETIKEYLPDDKHAYSNHHHLAFMCTTGMTQGQYKKAYGVDDPQSALDSVQSQRLERIKQHIALYIQDGKEYQDIKRQLLADF